jgi:tetratricopeptide (TPR) repeat protein
MTKNKGGYAMRTILPRVFVAAAIVAGASALCLSVPAQAASASKQVEDLEIQAFDLMDKGDMEGAIAKFRAARALKSNDKALNQNLADVLNSTGVALYNNRDFAGASARFTEAIQLVPNFNRAKENLGKVKSALATVAGNDFYKAGNLEGAREKYVEAAAQDPNNLSAKANLANTEADLLEKNGGDLAAIAAKRHEASSYVPDNQLLKQRANDAASALAAQEAAKKAEEEKNKK